MNVASLSCSTIAAYRPGTLVSASSRRDTNPLKPAYRVVDHSNHARKSASRPSATGGNSTTLTKTTNLLKPGRRRRTAMESARVGSPWPCTEGTAQAQGPAWRSGVEGVGGEGGGRLGGR